jgi:hypothetical protein
MVAVAAIVAAIIAVPQIQIARHIHQIWHDFGTMPEPPIRMQQWSRSWADHHPEWKHTLWGVADSRDLVEQHYSWFLPTYDGFGLNIERVDAFKYIVVHHFGGIYVDLDTLALQPIDAVLRATDELVFAQMAPIDPAHPDRTPLVANGFFAALQGHPFLEQVLHDIQQIRQDRDTSDPNMSTGNRMLMSRITQWVKEHAQGSITIWPNTRCYPFNWETQLSETALWCKLGMSDCAKLYREAVFVDFFDHSWKSEDADGYSWLDIEGWLHNALVIDQEQRHSRLQLIEAAKYANMSVAIHSTDGSEWQFAAGLHTQLLMRGNGQDESGFAYPAVGQFKRGLQLQAATSQDAAVLPHNMIALADWLLVRGRTTEALTLTTACADSAAREYESLVSELFALQLPQICTSC